MRDGRQQFCGRQVGRHGLVVPLLFILVDWWAVGPIPDPVLRNGECGTLGCWTGGSGVLLNVDIGVGTPGEGGEEE